MSKRAKRPTFIKVNPASRQPREQDPVMRKRLLDKIQESLAEMSAADLHTVAQFVNISERNRGWITPAEDFIVNLVEMHEAGYATPDYAEDQLKTFRSDFEAAIGNARWLASRHPDLVTGKPSEGQQAA